MLNSPTSSSLPGRVARRSRREEIFSVKVEARADLALRWTINDYKSDGNVINSKHCAHVLEGPWSKASELDRKSNNRGAIKNHHSATSTTTGNMNDTIAVRTDS